jgi:hypothetical protein
MLARSLLWVAPCLTLGICLGLHEGWFAKEDWETRTALTCGKQQIQLAEDNQAQQSLTGLIQVLSNGVILLGESKDSLERIVLLPCGERLKRLIYEISDFSIRTSASGDLLKMTVWGQCLPWEESSCSTFLLESAVLLN